MSVLTEAIKFVEDRSGLRQRLYGDWIDDMRKRAALRRAAIAKDANIPMSAIEGDSPSFQQPQIVVNNPAPSPPAALSLWPVILSALLSGGAGAGLVSWMGSPASPAAQAAKPAPFSREIKIKLFNERGELIPSAEPVEPTTPTEPTK